MKPVYVKIEQYKDVIDVVNLLKKKINEAKRTLDEINELKNKEDHELSTWHAELDDIEKRIELIDRILEEPQQV